MRIPMGGGSPELIGNVKGELKAEVNTGNMTGEPLQARNVREQTENGSMWEIVMTIPTIITPLLRTLPLFLLTLAVLTRGVILRWKATVGRLRISKSLIILLRGLSPVSRITISSSSIFLKPMTGIVTTKREIRLSRGWT
jgi:hypothetical protein